MSSEESKEAKPARQGLISSLHAMLATLLDIVQTRIEIAANEIEEERLHLETLVFYGLLAFLFLALGILLVTLFVILYFWEDQRLFVIGLFATIYLILGAVGVLRVRSWQKVKPKFLSATLTELQNDKEQLGKSK